MGAMETWTKALETLQRDVIQDMESQAHDPDQSIMSMKKTGFGNANRDDLEHKIAELQEELTTRQHHVLLAVELGEKLREQLKHNKEEHEHSMVELVDLFES